MNQLEKIKVLSASAYEFALKALKEIPEEAGRYDLSDDAFAVVNVYRTKSQSEGLFEAHKKYIDIQLMLKGCENIITEPVEIMHKYECIKPFEDGDTELYAMNNEGKDNLLMTGDFIILYPEDAHAPSICINEPEDIVKIVFKVPVK